MKVFKMNEYDWVAAKGIDEAQESYLKDTGVGEEENPFDEITECDIDNEGVWVEVNDDKELAKLFNNPKGTFQDDGGLGSYKIIGGDWFRKVPFRDVLPTEEQAPFVIASTEY